MSAAVLQWRFTAFDALSVQALYALLRLRSEVFVVEQQCVFLDADGSDGQAMHLLGTNAAGELLAYARCFGPGLKFAEASIGRVITAAAARGTGLGHGLMREALARTRAQWGERPIRIGAQQRLEAFYRAHGFVTASATYLEDGIAHVEMLWTPPLAASVAALKAQHEQAPLI